ncbi:MinD/ParA family protein [Mycobacterium sp. ACS1612]|uniref:MinD/ParA family ATP-binding protein n=1 Tax=Mycobacterium sp. ACS1612 TaxID=1834117 RepID=UPI001E2D3CE4|nr:MinD/ParA family protein [Mycobacterium sp. ACS1612]
MPADTSFTTTEPGTPNWQQLLNTPTAKELGLQRRSKPLARQRWRKTLKNLSGGTMPSSTSEPIDVSFADRTNRHGGGAKCIAVMSLKGGVGKTTTTIGLGATFASWRGDRVIAVDANPDFGTLAQRGPNETRSTVRDLLADQHIDRYSDIRRHTSQSSSRLELLASERDPAVSEAFSETDYLAVHKILDRFYNIILTDCGTGLTHSAMNGVLDTADALVVVAAPAVDSARSALATLDWLRHHGHARLASTASVVVSSARPGGASINIDKMAGYFQERVRSVVVIPYDGHLAEGGEISLELISRKARQAYMTLASSVAGAFGDSDTGLH